MLQSLKKYQKFNKPFYGINRGTYGFLMNKYKGLNVHNFINKTKLIMISPLEMRAFTKDGKISKAIYFGLSFALLAGIRCYPQTTGLHMGTRWAPEKKEFDDGFV